MFVLPSWSEEEQWELSTFMAHTTKYAEDVMIMAGETMSAQDSLVVVCGTVFSFMSFACSSIVCCVRFFK